VNDNLQKKKKKREDYNLLDKNCIKIPCMAREFLSRLKKSNPVNCVTSQTISISVSEFYVIYSVVVVEKCYHHSYRRLWCLIILSMFTFNFLICLSSPSWQEELSYLSLLLHVQMYNHLPSYTYPLAKICISYAFLRQFFLQVFSLLVDIYCV